MFQRVNSFLDRLFSAGPFSVILYLRGVVILRAGDDVTSPSNYAFQKGVGWGSCGTLLQQTEGVKNVIPKRHT
jgi:hypothetical protein